MTTILGLSGSLRRASMNAGLLRAARDSAPGGVQVIIGDIAQVPLYNGDEEAAHGTPPAVAALNEHLAQADGLLLATPEYNNGIPGVFKNVIDWMSRGEGLRLFAGKPVAVMGVAGRVRDHPGAKALVAGAADAEDPALVGQPPDGVAHRRAVRHRWQPDR